MQTLNEILEADKLDEGRLKLNSNFTAVKDAVDVLETLPDDIEIISAPQTIAVGDTVNYVESISHNRLYGVYVAISGLLEGETATVEFFGDDARTNLQYVAEFTDVLFEDTAQAWRYRDRESNNELKIRITNTGLAEITVTLTIRAEPF